MLMKGGEGEGGRGGVNLEREGRGKKGKDTEGRGMEEGMEEEERRER